ncbi:MAG: hypothetical protein FJX36_00380 [Alphaproteobacteria bacterium]|nr:hypothetical protein [Alphaproteobacteria bacterium]
MTLALALVTLVAAQRLAELVWSALNTRRLLAAGAIEVGRGHYPLMIAFHAIWLAALAVAAYQSRTIAWPALALFLALQPLRTWVLLTLGRRWTTRIIVSPAPLVSAGPYRWVRHPNYLIVAAEVATLPMVLGAWPLALVGSALHVPILVRRIAAEDAALTRRR